MAYRSKEVKYRSDRDYKGSNSVPTKPRYYIFSQSQNSTVGN